MTLNVLGRDLRCLVTEKLPAPAPLPFISRRALRRVADRLEPPTVCPCCGGDVSLVRNSAIYGREYGDWPYAYLCGRCGAYVGLHAKTDLPLGTLAGKELREARKTAKNWFTRAVALYFDDDRTAAYEWLAVAMGIPKNHCHFGFFDLDSCHRARLAVMALDHH